MNETIQKAVDEIGSQAALAKQIRKSQPFVNDMLHGRKPVPAGLCAQIELATKGAVTRYDLRPDVFGEDPGKAKRKGRAA